MADLGDPCAGRNLAHGGEAEKTHLLPWSAFDIQRLLGGAKIGSREADGLVYSKSSIAADLPGSIASPLRRRRH